MIHTVKGFSDFSEVSKAEIDVFLEFSCFFYDPTDVGNLISGSSAFSKSSLYIWKFLVHVLLKPSLEDFEHDLASMWNESNCVVIWTFFGIALLWHWNENWPCPDKDIDKDIVMEGEQGWWFIVFVRVCKIYGLQKSIIYVNLAWGKIPCRKPSTTAGRNMNWLNASVGQFG